MIRVQPVPSTDEKFRELVRFALTAAGATDHDHLVAEDEAMIERALVTIRRECPGASARRRDPLASLDLDDQETWYVFREDTVVADSHPAGT